MREAGLCFNDPPGTASGPPQGYRIWPMTDLAKLSDHPARLRFRLTASFGAGGPEHVEGQPAEDGEVLWAIVGAVAAHG
jgi:hypothetical protein